MKVFLLIYNEIKGSNLSANLSFFTFLEQNKLEWWKYAQDSIFIATPDSYDTELLEKMLMKLFPSAITAVLEVDVKKWSGNGPIQYYKDSPVSFLFWFEKISKPDYIPAWLRDNDIPDKYRSPINDMHYYTVDKKKNNNVIGQTVEKKDE